MKTIKIILAALSVLVLSSCQSDKPSTEPIVDSFTVPANKAYVVPLTEGRDQGVRIPVRYPEDIDVVSEWTDKSKSVVWYLYQKEGKYDFYLDNTVTEGKNLDFNLSVTECYDLGFTPISKQVKLEGTGVQDTLFCANVNIAKTGYYRYELKPISDPANEVVITSLLFNAFTEGAQVNQTDYQSSPSVHLAFSSTAETTKAYDWVYGEVMVPEGGDATTTFYMSLGFYRGYLGIQANSIEERRVLFSVWDSKDADHDTSMKAGDFVSLVNKGEETTVNSFGNEGTGGQSFVKDYWKTGTTVKFLMNSRPDTNGSTLLSAWYQFEGEDWKYIATWRAPKEDRMFDGYYSFIENFGYPNGQLRREAHYYNAWGHESGSDKWVHFNKVRFSNTDGKEGQRVDYEQGVTPGHADRFYMSSGGYTPTIKGDNEIALSTEHPSVDLSVFTKEVDHALTQESENKRIMEEKLAKANERRAAARERRQNKK